MEKHLKKQCHQGEVNFVELCKIAENLLASNIGSNEFHLELEKFLIVNFTNENQQDVVDLIKGLSLYRVQLEELNHLLYGFINTNLERFSIKQLEVILWSLSRKHMAHHPEGRQKAKIDEMEDYQRKVLQALVDRIKTKSPSMRPRGVAFAIEAFANLGYKDEELFKRMERVTLAKLDEFIPHYTVKVLSAYYSSGFGSGELYDQLINHVMEAMRTPGSLKYSDMLRFFEIYPEVTYIYDNTMSSELYNSFVETVRVLIKDKKFPTEDVCRVFNILIRISPYFDPVAPSPDHQKFLQELVGRIRHSVNDIPKEHFTRTMANMTEFQQPLIATKFTNILKEIIR